MDGFTGFKTAAAEVVPDAVAVMDPFHVVALAGDALDRCRQRVQQETRGHRGRTGDPLYGIRRALRTGADLLTDRQRQRIRAPCSPTTRHVEVEATWGIYQRIVAAYRDPDRAAAKTATEEGHRHDQRRRPDRADRADHPRPHPAPTRRRRARLLRPTRHQQRPDRSDQRPPRTPPRHRPRLPQPHQLHRQITARDRRLQTTTTPSIRMSPLIAENCAALDAG